MSDFSTMSAEELEKLRKEADTALAVIRAAVAYKDRSEHVLKGFEEEVECLALARLKIGTREVQRSYGAGSTTEVEITIEGSESHILNNAAKKILMQLAGSDPKPFALVPMQKFWAEWADALNKLTKLMVNRYRVKYVAPYPTDTAENILAVKVGEKIEEAATPAPEPDISF